MSCSQLPNEKVEDFLMRLKKLFRRAYVKEDVNSDVLLQQFLTGLLPPISRQLLIHGKPKTLDEAIQGAVQVEFGLEFGSTRVPQDASNYASGEKEGVASATGLHSIQEDSKLQKTMEELVHQLENLEVYVKRSQQQPRYNRRNGGRRRPIQDRKCWVCREEGHFQMSCPLNSQGPAQRVVGWPQK